MFRIGEFSKIAQIASSQLRFYDRIGLFQPEHIDQFTNYRYYRAAQLPKLHRILAMRDLGLSIEQIQALVNDNVSAETLHGMLALKKLQIQQEIQAQALRLRHIEARLQLVENEGDTSADDVVIKSLPDRHFYGFRTIVDDLRHVRPFVSELTQFLPAKVSKKHLQHLTILQHADEFIMHDADVEIGYLVHAPVNQSLSLSSGHALQHRTLPSIETVATIVRIGGPDRRYQCYESLGRWAEANGYQLSGPVQELFIVPPSRDSFAQTVIEIQMPVTLRKLPA